jgi:hypothetical protein
VARIDRSSSSWISGNLEGEDSISENCRITKRADKPLRDQVRQDTTESVHKIASTEVFLVYSFEVAPGSLR